MLLCFTELHRCCTFYKLKARPFNSKKITTCFTLILTLLRYFIAVVWNQTLNIAQACLYILTIKRIAEYLTRIPYYHGSEQFGVLLETVRSSVSHEPEVHVHTADFEHTSRRSQKPNSHPGTPQMSTKPGLRSHTFITSHIFQNENFTVGLKLFSERYRYTKIY